ncbi:MAG: hypothetical protein JWR38_5257 [Mucilaginibacter sp.]|nr:hypothetical protein [Mucilaginibacter sp.]
MVTFKSNFNIPEKEAVEFLNIPLDGDLKAFIDPFLIANSRQEPVFNDVYRRLIDFFTKLNREFIIPNDRRNGLMFLDNLHEPNEYHLGYSDSNKGKAVSGTRAVTIFDALRNNRFSRAEGVTITNEAHNILLLVTGIGQDIMSDAISNVSRDIFARFTAEQCIKYGIITETFHRHFFNSTTGLWEMTDFNLPVYKGKCIILLPNKMVSSARSYVNHYNHFVAGNYIAKDILDGKIAVAADGSCVRTLKDGTRKAIIKRIVETYGKPKDDLIDFVLEYNGSLDLFLDHAKTHYPAIDLGDLL